MTPTTSVAVIGGGMVGHRFIEALRDRDTDRRTEVHLFCEEPRAPYDRVGLTSYFAGKTPEELLLGDVALWDEAGVTLHLGATVSAIDTATKSVTVGGATTRFDAIVLATGSYAMVPPVGGADLPGSFVYRTIDDVQAIEEWAKRLPEGARGVVVGGGLLGLEAAGALTGLGVATTVVEFADRLMPMQVDDGGGESLRRIISGLGVEVRTSTGTAALHAGDSGAVAEMEFSDGSRTRADIVVFATGVRPRDELARRAGLLMGERGG
ncbi:MAG: NAD(P)/FAD-dependent oxidoreductase, partial [Marmoricola sp.]